MMGKTMRIAVAAVLVGIFCAGSAFAWQSRKEVERFKRDEAIDLPREAKRIKLDITADTRSGNIVLRTKDLLVGYRGQEAGSKKQDAGGATAVEERVLFQSPDLEVLRRARVALIGPNGSARPAS